MQTSFVSEVSRVSVPVCAQDQVPSEMKKKILLIEDDSDLFGLVKYNLEKEGFQVYGSQTGAGVIQMCRTTGPALVLLDIMLPEADGLEICRAMRRDPNLATMPVIFLTARGSETDRIVGLELGANDYIVKPFFIRELIARIRIQLRQSEETGRPAKLLSVASVELDRDRCEVRVQGEPILLTATEFRLLEYMMSRPGVVFTRPQLLDAVWGDGRAITDRAVDVFILRLRQKLEPDPAQPRLIHAVRGFGYKFDPTVAASASQQ